MDKQKYFNRRNFICTSSLGVLGTSLLFSSKLLGIESNQSDFYLPMIKTGKELVVQPLLRHRIEKPEFQKSWRNWGNVHTEEGGQTRG